jgi:predicted flap endonuclease-1-like 5' DNA nuclease
MDATVLWPTPRNFLRSLRFGLDVLVWSQQQTRRLFAPFLAGMAPHASTASEALPEATPEAEPEAASEAAPPADDDLTVIAGIGPKLAERLAHFGVTTFAQLAAWSPDDVERFDATLPAVQRGRVEREDWIGQAAELVTVPG